MLDADYRPQDNVGRIVVDGEFRNDYNEYLRCSLEYTGVVYADHWVKSEIRL